VPGFRLPEESKEARAQCGVVPQLDNLDTTLTVEQNLLVFAHLYRIGRSERKAAIERALVMAKRSIGGTRASTSCRGIAASPADRASARAPPAREVLEIYGPPARLAEVEVEAGAAGMRTRGPGRASRSSALTGRTASRSRESGARPTWRTSSSSSPARRLRDRDRPGSRRTSGSARALSPDRRVGSRSRELLVVLEVEHVLIDGRADDLPAGLRHAVFGWAGWKDPARVLALVVFGLIMWRIAIHAMTRKLID